MSTSGHPRPGVDREDRVRADPGAQGATRAGGRIDQANGMVAERIDDRGVKGEDVLRADVDTQPAAFATFDIYYYFASHKLIEL